MVYKLDRKFIKRIKFNITAIGLVFIAAGVMFACSVDTFADWNLLVGGVLVVLGFYKFKELKYWNADNDEISLEIGKDCLTVSDPYQARSRKISSIDKAVFQLIRGKTKSIILHSSDGGITKLKGFEAMDEIASHLKELLGETKVKTAKFFHR